MPIRNKDHVKLLKMLVNASGKDQRLEMFTQGEYIPDSRASIERDDIEEGYTISFHMKIDTTEGVLDYDAFRSFLIPSAANWNLGTPAVIQEFLEETLPIWMNAGHNITDSKLYFGQGMMGDTAGIFVICNAADEIGYHHRFVTDPDKIRDYCKKHKLNLKQFN